MSGLESGVSFPLAFSQSLQAGNVRGFGGDMRYLVSHFVQSTLIRHPEKYMIGNGRLFADAGHRFPSLVDDQTGNATNVSPAYNPGL